MQCKIEDLERFFINIKYLNSGPVPLAIKWLKLSRSGRGPPTPGDTRFKRRISGA